MAIQTLLEKIKISGCGAYGQFRPLNGHLSTHEVIPDSSSAHYSEEGCVIAAYAQPIGVTEVLQYMGSFCVIKQLLLMLQLIALLLLTWSSFQYFKNVFGQLCHFNSCTTYADI